MTKECSEYSGAAGGFCTITSSNLARIKVGSRVYYDQPAGIPADMLDSNVVLDAGNGNRAVGRCTLDLATGLGLCTFSDGLGRFAGFNARVQVSSLDAAGVNWRWEGRTARSICWPKRRFVPTANVTPSNVARAGTAIGAWHAS